MITPAELDWDEPSLKARCRALVAKGHSSMDIAQMISAERGVEPRLSKDSVQKRLQGLRADMAVERAALRTKLPDADPTPVFSALLARPKVKRKESLERMLKRHERAEETKVLAISDTHGRTCDEEALAWTLELGKEADLIIHLGDFHDWSTKSLKHAVLEHVPAEAEFEGGARTFRIIEDAGKDTLILTANHDLRPGRQFRAWMPSDLLWMFDDDVVGRYAERSSHVWSESNFITGWRRQFGNVLFAHAEVPNAASTNGAAGYLYDSVADDPKRFSVVGKLGGVITGHYHKGDLTWRMGGKVVLGMVPCLTKTQPYSQAATGARYKTSIHKGAMLLTFRHGKVVPHLTQLVPYAEPE